MEISGSVLGPLNLVVFDLRRDNRSYDIGLILNKVDKICKSIIVPEGSYYLQTPVKIENIQFYGQLGDIIYNGKLKDVTTFQFF